MRRVMPRVSVKTTNAWRWLNPADCNPLVSRGRISARQSSGKKSQAVLSLGGGIPGVSGEENINGPPISGAFAKLPGVVTFGVAAGLLAPFSGSLYDDEVDCACVIMDSLPYAGAHRIRFHGCFSAAAHDVRRAPSERCHCSSRAITMRLAAPSPQVPTRPHRGQANP